MLESSSIFVPCQLRTWSFTPLTISLSFFALTNICLFETTRNTLATIDFLNLLIKVTRRFLLLLSLQYIRWVLDYLISLSSLSKQEISTVFLFFHFPFKLCFIYMFSQWYSQYCSVKGNLVLHHISPPSERKLSSIHCNIGGPLLDTTSFLVFGDLYRFLICSDFLYI